jgi:hypothetical protein
MARKAMLLGQIPDMPENAANGRSEAVNDAQRFRHRRSE